MLRRYTSSSVSVLSKFKAISRLRLLARFFWAADLSSWQFHLPLRACRDFQCQLRPNGDAGGSATQVMIYIVVDVWTLYWQTDRKTDARDIYLATWILCAFTYSKCKHTKFSLVFWSPDYRFWSSAPLTRRLYVPRNGSFLWISTRRKRPWER